MEKELSAGEKLFCALLALGRGPLEAAGRSGRANRRLAAQTVRMLEKESVRRERDRWKKELEPTREAVVSGISRLAFGPVNDAVRLAAGESLEPEDLAELDLFAVSEIKPAKDGGFEVKFHDRLEALELLLGCRAGESGDGGSLFGALERGAAALGNRVPPGGDGV